MTFPVRRLLLKDAKVIYPNRTFDDTQPLWAIGRPIQYLIYAPDRNAAVTWFKMKFPTRAKRAKFNRSKP